MTLHTTAKKRVFVGLVSRLAFGLCLAGIGVLPQAAHADPRPSSTLFGTTGLIEMPTAQSADDGELSVNVSTFKTQVRSTLTFQITPRLSGSFRYSTIADYQKVGFRLWDRSFDLRYRFIDEGKYRPAVAIGLQDFLGTGVYSGEYLVATKTLSSKVTVTAGIGWGWLGTNNSFSNPLGVLDNRFKTRPSTVITTGGKANFGSWFRGPASLFGGVTYDVNDRLTVKVEYSSNANARETTRNIARSDRESKSPFNIGINYKYRPNIDIAASFVHGSEFALGVNFSLNPRKPNHKGTFGTAPLPVKPRPSKRANPAQWNQNWVASNQIRSALDTAAAQALAAEGLDLVALDIVNGTEARIQFRNTQFDALPQAIGRAARLMATVLPASVETFKMEPVVQGMIPTTTILRRSDLEALENAPDSSWTSFARAKFEPGSTLSEAPIEGVFPRWTWGIGPDAGTSFFDPDQPVRLDVAVLAEAKYDFAPGWSVRGAVRQTLAGNIGGGPPSNSVLQRVRTDGNIYAQERGPVLQRLTLDRFFKASDNVYGHVSVGYFEQMFGGISGELLWKPVESRLAFGAELNYVAQRDFDQRLGFQNYRVATGHVSAYYEMGQGFHGRLDVGRYLAGDWGATLAIDREFKNGWRVGAFATKTDVSSAEFGEGSFDKGIRIDIPLTWALGKPTRKAINNNLRPITRDGGARLQIDNRLYEQVREYHKPTLRNKWGRFWR
jgi:hypothetical protein